MLQKSPITNKCIERKKELFAKNQERLTNKLELKNKKMQILEKKINIK